MGTGWGVKSVSLYVKRCAPVRPELKSGQQLSRPATQQLSITAAQRAASDRMFISAFHRSLFSLLHLLFWIWVPINCVVLSNIWLCSQSSEHRSEEIICLFIGVLLFIHSCETSRQHWGWHGSYLCTETTQQILHNKHSAAVCQGNVPLRQFSVKELTIQWKQELSWL